MVARQISVFMENKKGRLASVTKLLGDHGIDMAAACIADTADFGILRCMVNKTDEALKLLQSEGYMANVTEVLAVEVPDQPGGLERVLTVLDENGVSVEYMYSFVRSKGDCALILFRVEETARAADVLTKNGIKLRSE